MVSQGKIKQLLGLIFIILLSGFIVFRLGYIVGERKSLDEFFKDVVIVRCNFDDEEAREYYCVLDTPLGERYIYDTENLRAFEELLESIKEIDLD